MGISKVKNGTELVDAIAKALRYSDKAIVEEFIDGREIEVAVLGNSLPASVCGEIKPGDEFYTYEDKYINGIATSTYPQTSLKKHPKRCGSMHVRSIRPSAARVLAGSISLCTKLQVKSASMR